MKDWIGFAVHAVFGLGLFACAMYLILWLASGEFLIPRPGGFP